LRISTAFPGNCFCSDKPALRGSAFKVAIIRPCFALVLLRARLSETVRRFHLIVLSAAGR
jgi:hypothetical protein